MSEEYALADALAIMREERDKTEYECKRKSDPVLYGEWIGLSKACAILQHLPLWMRQGNED